MYYLSAFSNLFLKFATSYSKTLEKIKEKAKNNPKPFNYLFNNGDRIYLPFIKSSTPALSEDDNKIIEILKNYKFTEIDYIKGYATSSDGRRFKILSALSKIENKLIKNTDNQDKINKIQSFFKRLSDSFTYSNSRKLTKYDDLTVVISQDPIDVATMSTDRSWSSCMNLKKEKSFSEERIICEVSSGGLVAYLIKSQDIDIQKPLARIWIRRFTNANGDSYAIPENKIYGNATEDFYNFVKKWLEQNQISVEGELSLEGSSWSDSFSNRSYFKTPNFLSEDDFLNLEYKHKVNTDVLLKIIRNYDQYQPDFLRKEIAPIFLNRIDNLTKYPKEYYYLFNLISESDDVYSIFLRPSNINFLKANKHIKEVEKIYNIIIKNNLSDIEEKQKNTLKELILDFNKDNSSNSNEINFSIFTSVTLQLLNICSEETFNEIINVVYFARQLKSIPSHEYYNFILRIFKIMIDRNIVNFKLLSILKEDLIYLFDSNVYNKSIFLDAFEMHPQKFKFMKNNIEKRVKSLSNPMIHLGTTDQAYLDKLKKILQNM